MSNLRLYKKYSLFRLLLSMVLVFMTFESCVSSRQPRDRFVFEDEVESITTPDSIRWCVVSLKDLDKIPKTSSVGYVGSYRGFHLIRYYVKMLTYPGQCFKFATSKESFTAEYEFEYTNRDSIPIRHRIQSVF